MDTITHTLLGALAARATAPAAPSPNRVDIRTRTMVGGLAAAFPDIDYLTFWIAPLTFLADWHRGPTHSLILLPLWALLLGLAFALLSGRRAQWRELVIISALGLTMQIASDVITVYGTQIFAPLSDFRASLGTTFVIDPYFSAIILVALLMSLLWRPRQAALAGLLLLAGYVSFQALLQHQARALGEDYIRAEGLAAATAHSLPQPLSPFNWKIIVSENHRYHETSVKLWTTQMPVASGEGFFTRLAAPYRPADALSWVRHDQFGDQPQWQNLAREVWHHNGLSEFRRFAKFPALYRIDQDDTSTCVWFTDLRYVFPGMLPAFRYGMCQALESESWQLYRLRRFSDNERQALDG